MTRLAELQSRAACRAVVTVESLIAEAEQVRAAALENGQLSAAVSAITAKAKLAGLWLEKRENLNRIDPNQRTDGQFMDMIDRPPIQLCGKGSQRRVSQSDLRAALSSILA
jgi:hypothetical protein